MPGKTKLNKMQNIAGRLIFISSNLDVCFLLEKRRLSKYKAISSIHPNFKNKMGNTPSSWNAFGSQVFNDKSFSQLNDLSH